MDTKKKTYSFTMMLLALTASALTACGKNSGGDTPQVATVPTYGYVNGQCYNTTANVQVAYNLCQGVTVTNNGYYWNGTNCLQTSTNTVVDPSYCNGQNGYNNGYQTGYGAGGPYQWNPYPNGHYPIGYFPTGYPSYPGAGQQNYTSQVCNGLYLWTSSGAQRVVTCNGWNCRGYFVYTQTTYRPILCL